MSFISLLNQALIVERPYSTLDGFGDVVVDDYGQPVRNEQTLIAVKGRIEPKDARFTSEQPLISQAGVILADHTIYLLPMDLTTADRIRREPDDGLRFEVVAIRDAGGQHHHLEVDAHVVEGPELEAS